MLLNKKKITREQDLKGLLTKEYLRLFGSFFLVPFFSFFLIIMGYINYDFYKQSEQTVEKYQTLLQEKISTFETSSLNFLYPTIHTRRIDNFMNSLRYNELEVRNIMDSLKTIAGPFLPYVNISIYNSDKKQISVGVENGIREIDFFNNKHLKKAYNKDRQSSISYDLNKHRVVYYRPYYTEFKKVGLIALEMNAGTFFQDFLADDSYIGMKIEDEVGNKIFMSNSTSEDYYSDRVITKKINDWSVSYYINRRKLVQTTIYIILLFIFLSLVFSILLYHLTRNLSNKVTLPIKKVSDFLVGSNFKRPDEIDLDELRKSKHVVEIDDLNKSVLLMVEQMIINLEEITIAKQLEKKASINNTLTQTNPHFLYNILSNIISLAELSMTEEIIQLSESSSHILRYSSSDFDKTVPLKEEIAVLKNYSKMMKIRYGKRVNISYQVPNEMNNIKIPKMSLHSILENAFKYGVSDNGDWDIEIVGEYYSDSLWEIRISDKGIGMTDSQIETFNNYNHLTFSEVYKIFTKLENTGMVNAYLRVRYYFEGKASLFILPTTIGSTIVFNRWE